jgi:hypothetical protein
MARIMQETPRFLVWHHAFPGAALAICRTYCALKPKRTARTGLLAALDEARDLDIPPRDESRVACSSSDARPLCPLFPLQV